MCNLLVKHGIADGRNPLVDEINHSALAGHHELFVLRGRLDPISKHGKVKENQLFQKNSTLLNYQ